MVLYGYFLTHIIDFIGQVHLFMFVVSVVFHNDIDAFGITFLVCLPVVFLAFHGHCYLVLLFIRLLQDCHMSFICTEKLKMCYIRILRNV